MAPFSCIEPNASERNLLLQIARSSIENGLLCKKPEATTLQKLPPALTRECGVFVTLRQGPRLRGCIGDLMPGAPLAQAVAELACSAAFRDPRFAPLQENELTHVIIELSLLSDLVPVEGVSRIELLQMLQPSEHGLLLQEGHHSATFLPTVWAQLPQREEFLKQLLVKAGLPEDHWSDDLKVSLYKTVSFCEDAHRKNGEPIG